jgi:hypothetical protein
VWTSSSEGGKESIILANMTPIIGKGAPAAIARIIPHKRIRRDCKSFKGLKSAKYDAPVVLKAPFLGKRRSRLTICHPLDLLFSIITEAVIETRHMLGNQVGHTK